MRKFLATLLASALIAATYAAGSIENPDFERPIKNNKIFGWQLALHGNPMPEIVPVEGVPGIVRAVKFDIKEQAELSGSLEQRVKLEPNTKYYAVIWVKATRPKGVYLEIAQLDAARKKGRRFSFDPAGSEDRWMPITGEFTTGATGEIQFCMRFRLDAANIGNTVYFGAPSISTEKPASVEKSGVELVPTFESCGYYFYPDRAEKAAKAPGAAALKVAFRAENAAEWSAAFSPSYDPGEDAWRGSIVNLRENTPYQVRFTLASSEGAPKVVETSFRTRDSRIKVGQEILLTQDMLDQGQLIIDKRGKPDGWIKYTAAPGTVLNGREGENAVLILQNARYIWIDGLKIRCGGSRHGIEVADSFEVAITNCDISDFGRVGRHAPEKDGKYFLPDGKFVNYDAGICVTQSGNLLIERNYIHDSRINANPWFFSHPAGPQGIYLWGAGGVVIRYNDFVGSDLHRWDDAIESRGNGLENGGPARDCDVYGNLMFLSNDDGIELDGGQMNIRTYFNRFEGYHCAVSTAPCLLGPSYVFRNLMTRPGDVYANPNTVIKNNYSVDGKGQIFIFNNTFHAPNTGAYSQYARQKLGGVYDAMVKGTTRNNLMFTKRSFADRVFEWKNDFAGDQFWSDDPADREAVAAKHRDFTGISNFVIAKPEFVDLATGDFRVKNPLPGQSIENFLGDKPVIGAFQNDGITQLPHRPVQFITDTPELNFRPGVESLSFKVRNNGDVEIAVDALRNRDFTFFSVTPQKAVLAPGSETEFTVKLLPAEMKSALLYKGLVLIRDRQGMSRPVSVYADFRDEPRRLADDAKLMAEVPGPFAAGEEFERTFTIPEDGTYYLLARVRPDAADREKFRFSIDGDAPGEGLVRPYKPDWKWMALARTGKTYEHFELTRGEHKLKLQFGNGLKVERMLFTREPGLVLK